jgi:hypothetical protein
LWKEVESARHKNLIAQYAALGSSYHIINEWEYQREKSQDLGEVEGSRGE